MKVKSCPCCGNTKYIGIQAKFISNSLYYRIICNSSFSQENTAGCGLRSDWYHTIKEAVEKWNIRNINEEETNIETSTLE